MKRLMKAALVVVVCLIAAGFTLKYFLVDRAPIPEASAFTVDLAEVRKLAAGGGEGLPVEVRALVIAEGAFPAWMVVAGGGGGKIPMIFDAYQVVYPDRTVIIDSVADRKAFDAMPFSLSFFDEGNYTILQESLKGASLVLITHEHFDHIGGIAASPYLKEILPHLLLTKEQIEGSQMEEAGFPEGALLGYVPISYDRYYAAAPGIVLIKAPGHALGQQMIYVLGADGTEYLFVGDIVWNRENLRLQDNRAFLMSLVLGEDLAAARGEIRWVIDNLYNNPANRIKYVVSHDRDQLREYIDAGVIQEGFR